MAAHTLQEALCSVTYYCPQQQLMLRSCRDCATALLFCLAVTAAGARCNAAADVAAAAAVLAAVRLLLLGALLSSTRSTAII